MKLIIIRRQRRGWGGGEWGRGRARGRGVFSGGIGVWDSASRYQFGHESEYCCQGRIWCCRVGTVGKGVNIPPVKYEGLREFCNFSGNKRWSNSGLNDDSWGLEVLGN